ncbi:MAG: PQQ-dependent sugar dehydrogenase [Gemmatimonadaceae bacterium]|nr:PQQ-dependent sugar dehydrogenase [Gemmatimonadaceae bacterium]MCC6430693.1 PQQ-dependent sugar dehydrogenase [Gemmatimonadaceae bacterium]
MISTSHRRSTRQTVTSVGALLLATMLSAACGTDAVQSPVVETPADSTTPLVDRTVWQTGLANPWDLAFLPDSTALITERGGRVRARRPGGALTTVATIGDVLAVGEGGLLGLAVDPLFATNRFIYICFSSGLNGANDNRLVRWRLAADLTQLTDRNDLVTGLPRISSGRHSGCRPRFGPDGYLWIGTGDAATGTNPQNPANLGGKVLRITRDGLGAPGNSLLAGGETRIYTLGHRNVQGIAFHPVTGAAYSAEHGPSFDDEVTKLTAGGNAGWNPVPGYNESVSMTDLTRYPTAMPPLWKSGSPARGTSGATFLSGAHWKGWQNALVIAQLVGAKLVVMQLASDGSLARETPLFADQGTRLRVPVQGPDGALYVATDVGGTGGAIWRVSPR